MSHKGSAVSHSDNGKNAPARMGKEFQALATSVSAWVGSKWAFSAALFVIAGWAITGPYFHYSDTWQLVVNTVTTIITFLMVFLIQNTQKRDARAIHLKLDEIIRSIRHAHNEMIDIGKLSDEELKTLSSHFEEIRAECEERKQHRAKLQRN
jgi:low affinity Fe/Cu permease